MRRILADAPRDPALDAVDDWLRAHPAARTLAVFAALPGEVDLAPVVARHSGRRWVYPRVEGDRLAFHVVENPAADLTSGAFGVREPSPSLPVVELSEIDAFFCPGLAFDARGGRLGRGRGFYDRALARARPDALRIGVCYACQMVEDTLSEAHDIRMHGVIVC